MICNVVLENLNLRAAHHALLRASLEASGTYAEAARALGIRVRTLQRQIVAFGLSKEANRHRKAKAAARPYRSKR